MQNKLNNKSLAPIVLFTYNRPDHLKKVLDSLMKNKESSISDLVVYSDGPKTSSDVVKVKQVRAILDSLNGFGSVRIIKRENNLGLANSVIFGVTKVLEENDRIIVLEDDLLVSPYFLSYMNQCLELYEDSVNVASIVGYSYPLNQPLPNTFF